jgi:hypothetical protein
LVRLLTISDIFAALIEHRTYKPTMPRAEAYAVLCGMTDKLEAALAKGFPGCRREAMNSMRHCCRFSTAECPGC